MTTHESFHHVKVRLKFLSQNILKEINHTLFDCGIKKQVETRVLDVTATLPRSAHQVGKV